MSTSKFCFSSLLRKLQCSQPIFCKPAALAAVERQASSIASRLAGSRLSRRLRCRAGKTLAEVCKVKSLRRACAGATRRSDTSRRPWSERSECFFNLRRVTAGASEAAEAVPAESVRLKRNELSRRKFLDNLKNSCPIGSCFS